MRSDFKSGIGLPVARRNPKQRRKEIVFIQLMPLLAGRTVVITVAREDENTVRVCVIPKTKDNENPALSTPLSYTGTPEELDAELGKHLASYVECHTQLGSTLAQAKAEMEAAAKAAQEEARKKAAERSKKVAEKSGAKAEGAPAASTPTAPAATMALFGGSQPIAASADAATATAAGGVGEKTRRRMQDVTVDDIAAVDKKEKSAAPGQ
jgi:PRTRC genetic system protein E